MIGVVIVFSTLISYAVGGLVGLPALMPLLNTLPALPFMWASLKRERTGEAIARMLLWALAMGLCATAWSYADSVRTDRLFLNGEAYRREMFGWVLTGAGAESSPRQFLPMHAAHAALFSVLSLASGSLLSMPMGAVLMNYMGHYVGARAAASAHPVETTLLAWVPWSIIRIVSFVTLGVVLAGPVLARVGRFRFDLRAHVPFITLAVAGLVADVLIKWLLAPAWRMLLLRSVAW